MVADVGSIIVGLIFLLWIAGVIWFITYCFTESMAFSLTFAMFVFFFILVIGIYCLKYENTEETVCPICGESYSDTEYKYCPMDGAEFEACEK